MPDAHGNIKGIALSVDEEKWNRIFGRHLPDETTPPTEEKARELGCTCKWWGGGCIIEFDKACPIYDRHRHPNRDNNSSAR